MKLFQKFPGFGAEPRELNKNKNKKNKNLLRFFLFHKTYASFPGTFENNIGRNIRGFEAEKLARARKFRVPCVRVVDAAKTIYFFGGAWIFIFHFLPCLCKRLLKIYFYIFEPMITVLQIAILRSPLMQSFCKAVVRKFFLLNYTTCPCRLQVEFVSVKFSRSNSENYGSADKAKTPQSQRLSGFF